MLRNGTLLIFRKFRTHFISGGLFIVGMAIGYAWLFSALYRNDWFGFISALVLWVATSYTGYPILSKKELALYKIFGAQKRTILPFIMVQAIILSIITTLVALAFMGMISHDLMIDLHHLQISAYQWLVPSASGILILLIALIFYRLFIASTTSISRN